jgi:hypothetical protein
MMQQLEEFKTERDNFEATLDRRDHEVMLMNRFIKREVIDIADTMDLIKDEMLSQREKIDDIQATLRLLQGGDPSVVDYVLSPRMMKENSKKEPEISESQLGNITETNQQIMEHQFLINYSKRIPDSRRTGSMVSDMTD